MTLRLLRSTVALDDAWSTMPVAPRGSTALGISIRSPQLEAFELDGATAVPQLMRYPFEIVRLGAYWNRMERRPGEFDASELDGQVAAADRAGKRIIICVGAVKTFGYPEFFVPRHRLRRQLPERTRLESGEFGWLLEAAVEQVQRVVDRYRGTSAVLAWQVEHESVDPLGFEHSWRLDRSFVRAEVDAVRTADPSRPVLLNGYLPTSLPVHLTQWFQTRDQGDSLVAAERLADIVGLDYYPYHALVGFGDWTLYIDGRSSGGRKRVLQLFGRARRMMLTEGQAEPWEAVTRPPNPRQRAMRSCPPHQVIDNYNRCMAWARAAGRAWETYLFWGAEYWLARERAGDPSYLRTFDRILECA